MKLSQKWNLIRGQRRQILYTLDKKQTNTKNNKFVRNWQDKETYDLGAQLVKNLNKVCTWDSKLKK